MVCVPLCHQVMVSVSSATPPVRLALLQRRRTAGAAPQVKPRLSLS